MTAIIKTKTQTKTSGQLSPITWVDRITAECLFWRGSISKKLLGERLSPDVSAVALFKPSEVGLSDINTTDKISIYDESTLIGEFAVISPDDIGQQNEVLMVPLKEYK